MRRRVLADRNMRILFIGQSMNMLGNYAMLVVLGIWVKTLTGSSADAGLIFLLLGATSFLAPLTGLLVDRFPRRWVLITNDVVTAGVMALLVLVHDRREVWIIYLVAGVYGTSGQIYRAARGGLVHSMVPDKLLGDANGLLSSLTQLIRIIAPLVGAGVFAAWGGNIVALADIGTFVFSIASYLALRLTSDLERPERDPSAETPARGKFGSELLAGVRHVIENPVIRRMVVASVIAFGGAGMIDVAMFSLVSQGLHRSAAWIGVITAIEGAGGVAAAFCVGALFRKIGEYAVACAGFVLVGSGLAVSSAATVLTAIVGGLLLGVGLPMVLVAELTIVQRRTSAELQGRAISASNALIDTPFTISIAIGAAIIGAVGFRVIYLGCAAAFIAVAIALLPYLKLTKPEPDEPDEPDEPTAQADASEPIASPTT
jgi:MFS family permease